MSATADTTREEWLAERQTGIGASDAPVVLGLNQYKSPFQLWAEKTGEALPDDEPSEPAEWGIRLERPIAEAFAERTGRRVELWPPHSVVRHPGVPWLLATPDATQEDESRGGEREGLLQIKTASQYTFRHHWADGPPLAHQVQCQQELHVTGFTWGTLCVLIGGQKLRSYEYELNPRFIDALLPKLEMFWQSVVDRVAPPVDGSLSTAAILAKLHPEDDGDTVMLPHGAIEWTQAYEQAQQKIKEAEAIKREAENRLKAAIGDATFGLTPNGERWSWKLQQRSGYTVGPTSYRVLRKVK